MRNPFLAGTALLALAHGSAQAADLPVKAPPPAVVESAWRFNPSISGGYASFESSSLSFSTLGGSLGGVNQINLRIPQMSGYFIAGELPVALTDRITVTFGGRWVSSGSGGLADERYNINTASRSWDTNAREWGTAEALLSYALVKNPAGFMKNVSAIIGARWDRHEIDLANAQLAAGVQSSPSDTNRFRADTYSPVFGLSASFRGYKSGIWGGDIKLSAVGSPWTWGNMNYDESFGTAAAGSFMNFNGNIEGSFYKVAGEATVLSFRTATGQEVALSILADYTKTYIRDTTVTGTLSGAIVSPATNFSASSQLGGVVTVGAKGSVAF